MSDCFGYKRNKQLALCSCCSCMVEWLEHVIDAVVGSSGVPLLRDGQTKTSTQNACGPTSHDASDAGTRPDGSKASAATADSRHRRYRHWKIAGPFNLLHLISSRSSLSWVTARR